MTERHKQKHPSCWQLFKKFQYLEKCKEFNKTKFVEKERTNAFYMIIDLCLFVI